MYTRAVHLPDELYEEVKRISIKNRRTVPAQLRVIVEEWVKLVDKAPESE